MADHYLRKRYYEEVIPTLMTDFAFANVMQAPKILKVVVNVGVGEALENAKALDNAVDDMTIMTRGPAIVFTLGDDVNSFRGKIVPH